MPAPLPLATPEPSPEKRAEPSAAPANAIVFSYAGAVSASGNILSDAIIGLEGLEALINTQYLYAPQLTPIVQGVGPIYRIPDFELRADRFTLGFERVLVGDWRWAVVAGYQVIYGFSEIPLSFVDLNRYGFGNGYIPVTLQNGGRLNLAQTYQLDGSLQRRFVWRDGLSPFVSASFGVGSGWLGSDRKAWLQEVHIGVAGGIEADVGAESFARFSLDLLGFQSNTRATNFVDRTQVLVNPGRGEILLTQLRLALGRRF